MLSRRLSLLTTTVLVLGACEAPIDPVSSQPRAAAPEAPALQTAALDSGRRTIPYNGYVDFDGAPVSAGSVKFNFALFPCATPGTDPACAALWVAKGEWTNTADWHDGWPSGDANTVSVPVVSGRFAVELGAVGQNELLPPIFEAGYETLYLGVRIEGKALGVLQKIVPAAHAHVAERAHAAGVADMLGDLTPDDIAALRRALPPIGTIMAWHKSLGGVTPPLPATGEWVECNGQTLGAVGSVYDGLVIPNLNGALEGAASPGQAAPAAMFLRGGTASGTGQLDAFQGHIHDLESGCCNGGTPGLGDYGRTGGRQSWAFAANITGPRDDGANGAPRTASETRPMNMSVVWIMKVK